MLSPKHFSWTLAFSLSLHINLVFPVPLPYIDEINSSSLTRVLHARDKIPLLIQFTSWPANHSPVLSDTSGSDLIQDLPQVPDVFKLLNIDPLSSPTPSVTVTLTPEEPADLKLHGPGLAIVPSSIANPEPTSSASPLHRLTPPAPVKKFIVITAVMLTIIGLTFLVFILIDYKAPGGCWRRAKELRRETRENSGLGIRNEKGKVTEEEEEREELQRPSSHSENKVIDIVSDFPRSKFSVTSSDYPLTIRSSTSSFLSILAPIEKDSTDPSPLLPPDEFFRLPSASDPSDNRGSNVRHSRAHSAPIFGHSLPVSDFPPKGLRSGDHRKSKSISGLVYMVERRATDSYQEAEPDKSRENSLRHN